MRSSEWIVKIAFTIIALACVGGTIISFNTDVRNIERRDKCTEKGGVLARKWGDGNLAFRCVKSFDPLE